jgi:SAM-dependent methyltransferase
VQAKITASFFSLSERSRKGLRLFLFSFLILYLELALIRFTSAEVMFLGYFSNFVLISVFLGIGIGFLLVDKRISLFQYTPTILMICIAFVLFSDIDVVELKRRMGQIFFSGIDSTMKFPLWFSLVLLFLMVTGAFAGLAQEAGRCFKHFPPILAYSIDICGSLAGIAVFTSHSYFQISPFGWFFFVFVLLAAGSLRRDLVSTLIMGCGAIIIIAASDPDHYVVWSPYQRVDVIPFKYDGNKNGYYLTANGLGHQGMQEVGTKEPIYDFPYTGIRKQRGGKGYNDVLIIGAGSGTDVAYALYYGVKAVDAVDIDPAIMEAGVRFHPVKPYADKRVRRYVDDGRAFLEQTDKRYDLIIYALPDSLASLSNFANIRLESFLFTIESFQQAKNRLKEDGALVLYNFYRRAWLFDKLADMLTEVFGHPPIVRIYGDENSGMLAGLAVGPNLAGPTRGGARMYPATDNWPFPYMERPSLPPMYLAVIFFFVACAVAGVFATGHGSFRNMQINGAFTLMGAAFLLLETKSVIQFSLLFGATWLVNSLVFFAVLVSVLFANLVVHKYNFKRPQLLFIILLASILVQYLVPLHSLLNIEIAPVRYLVVSVLLFSPIFFANLVFGFFFKGSSKAAAAFGWNIIGTIVGAALEYTSIAIGYRTLTLVILALYSACFLWVYIHRKAISDQIGHAARAADKVNRLQQ